MSLEEFVTPILNVVSRETGKIIKIRTITSILYVIQSLRKAAFSIIGVLVYSIIMALSIFEGFSRGVELWSNNSPLLMDPLLIFYIIIFIVSVVLFRVNFSEERWIKAFKVDELFSSFKEDELKKPIIDKNQRSQSIRKIELEDLINSIVEQRINEKNKIHFKKVV